MVFRLKSRLQSSVPKAFEGVILPEKDELTVQKCALSEYCKIGQPYLVLKTFSF